MDCLSILRTGLDELGIDYQEEQAQLVQTFLQLIQKWNKAYNLTAIRSFQEMARLHALDSLTVLPHIYGSHVADIGTGAGLPGIPLAIFLPECQFTLVDSNSKKTRFVQQAVLELGLKNVSVQHQRVEQFKPQQLYSTVIMRAFAELEKIMKLTSHLLADDAVLLAMKSKVVGQELPAISEGYSVIPLVVPGVEADRCLIRIQRQTNG